MVAFGESGVVIAWKIGTNPRAENPRYGAALGRLQGFEEQQDETYYGYDTTYRGEEARAYDDTN